MHGTELRLMDDGHQEHAEGAAGTVAGDGPAADLAAQAGAQEAGEAGTRIVVRGEPLLELPDDLYIPPDALEVFLDQFEGPLDLLLYLIRKQNLDILDIPVAKITHQYMAYVELMRQVKLDLAAEYLVMAAMLAEIKSRMLMPRPAAQGEEDEEDPRAALVRRLQEYERYRTAAQQVEQLPRVERDVYLAYARFESTGEEVPLPEVTLDELVRVFGEVAERASHFEHLHVGRETLSVRERMTEILDRLHGREHVRFEDLFRREEGRMGMVVSFLAILELIKDRLLQVVQNEPFSPIHLRVAA